MGEEPLIQSRLFPVARDIPSDDYLTPRWVFDAMGLTFDIDVCAPPGGVPWIPATRHYDQTDDGLAQPWRGRVWMNPPFSGTDTWIKRFIHHRHGVCLVPHSRARWHTQLWESDAALADPNRGGGAMFEFVKNEGLAHVYMPVFVAAFGDDCVEAIGRLGTVRKVAA
jgi:hypothetical protein